MFEKIINFFKGIKKVEDKKGKSKDAAKERLHLVLMQDRANVSADFLELMKQEIIDVIKKYIEVDESAIDVRLTNKTNEDGSNGAPALYANIPITNIKNDIGEVAKDHRNENINSNIIEKKEEIKKVEEKEKTSVETITGGIKEEENEKTKDEIKEIEKKEENAQEEIKEAEELKEKVETEIEKKKEDNKTEE